MVKFFGKQYYIDLDGITAKCRTDKTITEDDDTLEINIFKYEIIKMCLDRVLSEYEDENDELVVYNKKENVSFNIAFNTLIKYEILIEEDDE